MEQEAEQKTVNVYFAAPLFTSAEQYYNIQLKNKIKAVGVNVLFPQEFCADVEGNPVEIFKRGRDNISTCDFMVAILDGAQVDDGTAWEIGYAYAKGKIIIGLRTDFRCAGENSLVKVNCMIDKACWRIHTSEEEVLKSVDTLMKKIIKKM